MSDHHLSTETLIRRSTVAALLGGAAVFVALVLLWIWITQPVWEFEYVWPQAQGPLAVIVIILAVAAVITWIRAPDRNRLAAVITVSLGVIAAVAVIPTFRSFDKSSPWRIYAIDRHTGKVLWTHGPIQPTRLAAGPLVYAASGTYHLLALDPRTGRAAWQSDHGLAGFPGIGPDGLPARILVGGGVVAYLDGAGQVHGLDAVTGITRWDHPAHPGANPTSLAIDETSRGDVMCITATPGQLPNPSGGQADMAFALPGGTPLPPAACAPRFDAIDLMPRDGGPAIHIRAGQTSSVPFPPYDSPCGGPAIDTPVALTAVRLSDTTVYAQGSCIAAYAAGGKQLWATEPDIPGRSRITSEPGYFTEPLITGDTVLVLAAPPSKPYLGGA